MSFRKVIEENRKLQEEISRMNVLSGIPIKADKTQLEESLLSRVAGILGITIASLTGALGQNNTANINKSQDAIDKLQNALQDTNIQNKLKQIGVQDKNIEKTIDQLQKGAKPIEVKTHSERALIGYLQSGYHLTKVQIDTLNNTLKAVAPLSQVIEIPLTFNDSSFFQSGKFVLNQKEKEEIMHTLDTIQENGDILDSAFIESSTDKQGLSQNLQQTLQSLGYSSDNQGLSTARNNTIKSVLEAAGISDTIIIQTIKAEQGSAIIDQSARYVKLILKVTEPVNSILAPPTPQIKAKYELISDYISVHYPKEKHRKTVNKSCTISINKADLSHSQCKGPSTHL